MNSKFAYEEQLIDYLKVGNLFSEFKDLPHSDKETALRNLGITPEMVQALRALVNQQQQNSNNGD